MSAYYHTALLNNAPINSQGWNEPLCDLDRILMQLSRGRQDWSSLAIEPAAPPAGYGRLYFYGNSLRAKLATITLSGSNYGNRYAILQDQEASGSTGGVFVAGSWQTRTLNTITYDPYGLVTLIANVLTLNPGNYIIHARAAGNLFINRHRIRLYDTTHAAAIAYGLSTVTGDSQNYSELWHYFTVASITSYTIEHQSTGTILDPSAKGVAQSTGEVEVFAQVELWKV